MGAYENPRIIPTPDYGQIFRNNFIAGQQMVESAFARKKAAEEKERLKKERIADKELAFALQVGEIKAGDMTNALQQLGYNEANVYAENLRKYENNEISWQDFSQNRINSFKKLGELKEVGIILKKQTDELKDFDKSSFQENPELWGLQEAWEQQKIIPEYIDGELFLTYPGADGKNHSISVENLKDGTFFNYNEKRNLKAANYTALTVDAQITKKISEKTTYDASGNLVGAKVEEYEATREEYVDNMVNGNKMSELFDSVSTNGSIWLDDIVQTVDENTLRSMLTEVAKNNNLSEEEQKQFLNIALNKQEDGTIASNYSDINIGKNSYRGLIDQVSKRVVAERAFDDYLPQGSKLKPPVEIFRQKEPPAPGSEISSDELYLEENYGGAQTAQGQVMRQFYDHFNKFDWKNKTASEVLKDLKNNSQRFGKKNQVNNIITAQEFIKEYETAIESQPNANKSFLFQASGNAFNRNSLEKNSKLKQLYERVKENPNQLVNFTPLENNKVNALEFNLIQDENSVQAISSLLENVPLYFDKFTPNIIFRETERIMNK